MRDNNGRFLPGESGNPGGVSKSKQDLVKALSEIDPGVVINKLKERIDQGDLQAIAIYFAYILGKPRIIKEDLEKPVIPRTVLVVDGKPMPVEPGEDLELSDEKSARILGVLHQAGAIKGLPAEVDPGTITDPELNKGIG